MKETIALSLVAAFLTLADATGTASAVEGRELAGTRLHHRLEVRLDPEARSLHAVDRIRITGAGDVAFRLGAEFEVERLLLDGEEIQVASAKGEWRLHLHEGDTHQIAVYYRGKLAPLPQTSGAGGPTHPVSDVEGSFFPASSGWYPTFDVESYTYHVELDVPESQRALVPGRLLAEEVADGRYRARFAVARPARELVLIAGPYRITERFQGDIRIRTYFHPELSDLEQVYLSKSAEYLEMYGKWIGPYPFSAFHIVSSPMPVGLGYPYLTYVGRRVLRLPFIPHTSLGHEVLHSWWGNGVYVDAREGNWVEGLTTFMADYALAARRGPDGAREMRLRWLRHFAALPRESDRPLHAFTERRHAGSRIVGYQKGAFLFLMLRDWISADLFDAGIRRFWRRHRHQRAGWTDLQRAFEEVSGLELGGFFDQWLYRVGAPDLRLAEVAVEPRDGRFRVAFRLSQDRPAYVLQVPIVITTAAGERRFLVCLEQASARYVLTVDSEPSALRVDPDFEMFRRLDPLETSPTLVEVTLNPLTRTVIAAADSQERAAARALARRIVEEVDEFEVEDEVPPDRPLLVVGTTHAVEEFLAKGGFLEAPDNLRGRGTARVWAARRGGNLPLLTVEAEDAQALRDLLRPLPHYGSISYLVFEGGEVVEQGMWPVEDGPLRVDLR